jgi:Delta3-Delta2-enoyl-CoA isomerase
MQTINTIQHDQHLLISLNRGKANPINMQMVLDLREAFKDLAQNPELKGAILTGQPRYFSAGLDVVELYDYDHATMREFWVQFSALIVDMVSLPKPLIAAISGHSPAGGCVLALCCDQRLMAEGPFRIGLNEVPVGIVVPPSIYFLYAAVMGEGKAYHHLLNGSLMLPEEALTEGLVHQVLPQEVLLAVSESRLKHYFSMNPTAWGVSKLLLRKQLLSQLQGEFEELFGPVLKHWWSADFRVELENMIKRLKK